MTPDNSLVVHSIVDTIVQTVHPVQVVLFGSQARGTARQDSDYDFLVTVEDVRNERTISRRIYRALLDKRINVAVDLVVVSSEKLKRHRDNPFFIYHQALKEGQVFHERMARI